MSETQEEKSARIASWKVERAIIEEEAYRNSPEGIAFTKAACDSICKAKAKVDEAYADVAKAKDKAKAVEAYVRGVRELNLSNCSIQKIIEIRRSLKNIGNERKEAEDERKEAEDRAVKANLYVTKLIKEEAENTAVKAQLYITKLIKEKAYKNSPKGIAELAIKVREEELKLHSWKNEITTMVLVPIIDRNVWVGYADTFNYLIYDPNEQDLSILDNYICLYSIQKGTLGFYKKYVMFDEFSKYILDKDLCLKIVNDCYAEVGLPEMSLQKRHELKLKDLGIEYQGVRTATRERPHRITHCWSCKGHLDNSIDIECVNCSWILCSCGACGCGYGH